MGIQIIFQAKDACEIEYKQSVSYRKAYQLQQDTLRCWEKTHKLKWCLTLLLRAAIFLSLVWLFFFYDIPRKLHSEDPYALVPSILIDIGIFFAFLICSKLLFSYARKILILKGKVLSEPSNIPEQRHQEQKYKTYRTIKSLLCKSENVYLAIMVALAAGFKLTLSAEDCTECNYLTIDFDKEKISFSAALNALPSLPPQ